MKNNPITIKIQSSRKLKWEIGIPSKSKVYYLFEYCDIKYHFAHMEANIGYKYNIIFFKNMQLPFSFNSNKNWHSIFKKIL